MADLMLILLPGVGTLELTREQYEHGKSLLEDAPVGECTSREADNLTGVPPAILRS